MDQNGDEEQRRRGQSHNPVLRSRITPLHLRKVDFRHRVNDKEKNDKPRIVDNDLDTADAQTTEAPNSHGIIIYHPYVRYQKPAAAVLESCFFTVEGKA